MSDAPKPLNVAADVGTALLRLADATDRLVFIAEALAVKMEIVDPEDVGMEVAPKKTA
jgi:hypothetical protein